MNIALYSRKRNSEEKVFIAEVIRFLHQKGCKLWLHENCTDIEGLESLSFSCFSQLSETMNVDFVFSLGGDGTFIDVANLVADRNIPIVGINTGRIGFLTGIKKENFEHCFSLLCRQQYIIKERTLLHLHSSKPIALRSDFALNDITVRTSDQNSISAISVWADGKKINTYWADGIIIATPTGSTAYSLSCGGPIIEPSTGVHILTPIASHTLGVRPIVIPSDVIIRIVVESRNNNFSLALDSDRVIVENPVELTISKEKFTIKTVFFDNADFYAIIREKLLWGLDKRNGDKFEN